MNRTLLALKYFTKNKDPRLQINDGDIYLLKKLGAHLSDTFCRHTRGGRGVSKTYRYLIENFKKDFLGRKLGDDQDALKKKIVQYDSEKDQFHGAVKNATSQALEELRRFAKKGEIKVNGQWVKSPEFQNCRYLLRKDYQKIMKTSHRYGTKDQMNQCNFNFLVDSILDNKPRSKIESLLHLMNSTYNLRKNVVKQNFGSGLPNLGIKPNCKFSANTSGKGYSTDFNMSIKNLYNSPEHTWYIDLSGKECNSKNFRKPKRDVLNDTLKNGKLFSGNYIKLKNSIFEKTKNGYKSKLGLKFKKNYAGKVPNNFCAYKVNKRGKAIDKQSFGPCTEDKVRFKVSIKKGVNDPKKPKIKFTVKIDNPVAGKIFWKRTDGTKVGKPTIVKKGTTSYSNKFLKKDNSYGIKAVFIPDNKALKDQKQTVTGTVPQKEFKYKLSLSKITDTDKFTLARFEIKKTNSSSPVDHKKIKGKPNWYCTRMNGKSWGCPILPSKTKKDQGGFARGDHKYKVYVQVTIDGKTVKSPKAVVVPKKVLTYRIEVDYKNPRFHKDKISIVVKKIFKNGKPIKLTDVTKHGRIFWHCPNSPASLKQPCKTRQQGTLVRPFKRDSKINYNIYAELKPNTSKKSPKFDSVKSNERLIIAKGTTAGEIVDCNIGISSQGKVNATIQVTAIKQTIKNSRPGPKKKHTPKLIKWVCDKKLSSVCTGKFTKVTSATFKKIDKNYDVNVSIKEKINGKDTVIACKPQAITVKMKVKEKLKCPITSIEVACKKISEDDDKKKDKKKKKKKKKKGKGKKGKDEHTGLLSGKPGPDSDDDETTSKESKYKCTYTLSDEKYSKGTIEWFLEDKTKGSGKSIEVTSTEEDQTVKATYTVNEKSFKKVCAENKISGTATISAHDKDDDPPEVKKKKKKKKRGIHRPPPQFRAIPMGPAPPPRIRGGWN